MNAVTLSPTVWSVATDIVTSSPMTASWRFYLKPTARATAR